MPSLTASLARTPGLGPLLGLFAGPRLPLALIGIAAWVFGGALLGMLARMGGRADLPALERAQLSQSLVSALVLLALPAMAGCLAAEAAQEVLRRPATSRLPGAARRLGRAAWLFGALAVGVTLALAFAGSLPDGGALAASEGAAAALGAWAALAVLGFAAGAWLLARVGPGWGWVLRLVAIAALGHLALPLSDAFARQPAFAAAALALALAAGWLRFHPPVATALARGSLGTVFSPISTWTAVDEVALASERGERLMPAERTGGDTAGWLRARHFEQCTERLGTHPAAGQALTAFVALILIVVGVQVLSWATARIGGTPSDVALLERATQTLIGGERAAPGLFYLVALLALVQALGCLDPLGGNFLRPLGRAQRARLAFAAALRDGLPIFAWFALFGLAAGWAAALAQGEPLLARTPRVLEAAAMGPLFFAAFLSLGLLIRRAWRQGRTTSALLRLLLLSIPLFASLYIVADPSLSPLAPGPTALVAVAASFLAMLLLRPFLARFCARTDLV